MSTEPRLGIIISMFPELHETFILRELVALESRGLSFTIYSLQYPRDPITLDDARRLSEQRTVYSKLVTFNTIKALFSALLFKPVPVFAAITRIVRHGYDRPGDVLKNLAILPVTMHFAEHGKNNGVTHWHGHWANIPTTACWYIQQIHGASWSAAIHGEDIFSPNRFLTHKLDAATFSVVCSGYFCSHLKNNIGLHDPATVHLNYHGLDPRVMERAVEHRTKVRDLSKPVQLISIGRLVPTKGHDVLIRACQLLVTKLNIDFHLQLIGSGPTEAELKSLISECDLEKHVSLTGGLAFEQVLEALEQADIFCLAPRLIPGQPPDGVPNVIAEAMALRIPVVSTRVSAIPELIDSDDTGRLVEVDDVQAFAQAIATIASDPQLASHIRKHAFDKVSVMFDQSANIDELLALFENYVPNKVVA